MGPTAQKRARGVAAPLLPHRTRTGNAVARATHRALPGVQVSMQSRQHDLLAPTVCEALCRKMQRGIDKYANANATIWWKIFWPPVHGAPGPLGGVTSASHALGCQAAPCKPPTCLLARSAGSHVLLNVCDRA